MLRKALDFLYVNLSSGFTDEDDGTLAPLVLDAASMEREDVNERGEPFPLLRLPEELIVAVLRFLAARDLFAVQASCRELAAIANDPSLWRALYFYHRRYEHSAVVSMVHVGVLGQPCYSRAWEAVDHDDVKRFGWRRLAVTLAKRRCFECGARPSFVVFLDNTRKCPKCICTKKLRREIEATKRCWTVTQDRTMSAVRQLSVDERLAKRLRISMAMSQEEEEAKSKQEQNAKAARRLTRLAALLGEAGKHADAEKLLLEVLARDISTHGSESVAVANDYFNLAHMCRLQSNTFVYVRDEKIKICKRGTEYIAESVRVYERHLQVFRGRLEADERRSLGLRIADCLCMLAGYVCTTSTHLALSHKIEAEKNALKWLEKATEIYQQVSDERGLAEAYRISAGIFADTHHQDKDKAITYLQRSLALVNKIFGHESVQAADIMQKFGYMFWNWDRESVEGLEKSLEWHRQELDVRCSVMGPMHPITKRAREDVYIILDRLDRSEEALELYDGLPEDTPGELL